ncbi:MAG: S8 family serine peptidase [Flavobacteriales bacterium]
MTIKSLYFSLYFILVCGFANELNAQHYYWVYFSDKGEQTLDDVELSKRSLERRKQQHIALDFKDIPVEKSYSTYLKSHTQKPIKSSKWLNASLVYLDDNQLIKLEKEDFIERIEALPKSYSVLSEYDNIELKPFENKGLEYGFADPQISQLNAKVLHQHHYKGQGMLIAVLDAGFANVDQHEGFKFAFEENRIEAGPDFVLGDGSTVSYQYSSHGQHVLGLMAGYMPKYYIGTAPKANYLLMRTEDGASESLVEESYWLLAAEYADSVGADIINSSLGYTQFDDSLENHTYEQLDGNQTLITKAADWAASKGILVVNSAGNSGNSPWYYIGAPADGDSVLAVGSVDIDGNSSGFSSHGPRIDGEVKPNVSAMGQFIYVLSGSKSDASPSQGTSFSSPVLSGAAACLWQYLKTKNPSINNMDILSLIEESAHLYPNYDADFGYGIPNFKQIVPDIENDVLDDTLLGIYPNPFNDKLFVHHQFKSGDKLKIYNTLAQMLYQYEFSSSTSQWSFESSDLDMGLYFIQIENQDKTFIYKALRK